MKIWDRSSISVQTDPENPPLVDKIALKEGGVFGGPDLRSFRIPQNFLALRAKTCQKLHFALGNPQNFLRASREKRTKNHNLPLKTPAIFGALRAQKIY